MQKVNLNIAFNIIFWSLYFLYEWLGLAALSGEYGKFFINACMALPLALAISYLTVHVFLKYYQEKWGKWKFWIFQISASIALLLLRRCFNYYVIYPAFFPFALQVPFFSFGKIIVELVNVYLVVGVYALFYFVRFWYEERQRAQDLLQQKTTAELELLKSQVQPHFIFNALNNIYSTALKTNPETAKLIEHLSGFLHYNLYESKQEFVSLTSELLYIKHYIEIQKNRYGDKLDAAVNVYDHIADIYIAPLLLLPLIENCFTHGISTAVNQGWIRIDVSKQSHYFSIKIENSIDKSGEQHKQESRGIGLQNVEKRLQLIYPNRHEFKMIAEPHTCLVLLKIKIGK